MIDKLGDIEHKNTEHKDTEHIVRDFLLKISLLSHGQSYGYAAHDFVYFIENSSTHFLGT